MDLKNLKEKDLFNWLKENIYPDLVMAKNKMSRWDCYAPETRHRIELKCRRAHYPTLLIEKKKFDAVVDKCKKYSDAPIYINSTPKGIFAFDLSLVTVNWEVNNRNPATTYFGNNARVSKEVSYLSIEEAKQFI